MNKLMRTSHEEVHKLKVDSPPVVELDHLYRKMAHVKLPRFSVNFHHVFAEFSQNGNLFVIFSFLCGTRVVYKSEINSSLLIKNRRSGPEQIKMAPKN